MRMMKFSLHKPLLLLPLFAAYATLSTPTQAQSVPIQGQVTTISCTAIVNGGNPVILPDVSDANFPNVGDTAGTRTFVVNVNSCNINSGATVKAYFYGSPNDGRLEISSGSGSGWQYQLLPATGNAQLNVSSNTIPSNNANDPGASISGGSASINYRVRYYRKTQTITPGSGSTTVNMALFYP